MKIRVEFDNEDIFEGDCEEFLEVNEYDEELEEFLNNLENYEIGTQKIYYGNQAMEYIIEKLEDDSLWD